MWFPVPVWYDILALVTYLHSGFTCKLHVENAFWLLGGILCLKNELEFGLNAILQKVILHHHSEFINVCTQLCEWHDVLFLADSKGKRPLFCQFAPPLSDEKEPFRKKPLVRIYPFQTFLQTRPLFNLNRG